MIALALALQLACPICFGDPNDRQVHAARLGVFVLLAVTLTLLGAIALVARSWVVRARDLRKSN